jgi:hypothetical protein
MTDMGVLKYIAWTMVVLPTIIFSVLLYFAPTIIFGEKLFDLSLTLNFLGIALGYYSFIFSFYAALQVQAISDLYFFKMRSPEILKKLKKITKEVSDFGNESWIGLNSQRFMSESIVALRSAKRVNNKHVKRVAKEAEISLQTLKASMMSTFAEDLSAGQIPNYWAFYQKMSELKDEMSTQIDEARALP